ncbi:copper resistance CopC family protein [Solwaraspora sp. WMMB335]|uniref:copper resistance CopC family protein n=1 Tax=Solwaraspora sp. WMMB335 TaxID=3404118 RepID=UPI003B951593
MRRLLSLVTVLACAAAVVALPAAAAQAHTELVAAAPGPGDTVAPGVDTIALTFGPLDGTGAQQITVTGPDDVAVPIGGAVVVNAKTLCATVQPLVAVGVHTIGYQATSADGHEISGKFYFEVAGDGEDGGDPAACARAVLPSPGADPADDGADASDEQRGSGLRTAAYVGLPALAVALLLAGVGLALRARRRAANP